MKIPSVEFGVFLPAFFFLGGLGDCWRIYFQRFVRGRFRHHLDGVFLIRIHVENPREEAVFRVASPSSKVLPSRIPSL